MALVELHAADELVRDAVSQAGFFERARLRVDAVHDGDFAERVLPRAAAPPRERVHLAQDELRLFFLVVTLRHGDGRALAVAREQALFDPLRVGGYELGRCVENRLGRAVILLQRDDFGVGEVRLEAENVANVGVAPRVDGLVGVADGAQVAMLARDEARDGVLRHVGVLKLVYHKVDVSLAVLARDLFPLAQQQVCFEKKVVEIRRGGLVHQRLVSLIDAPDDFIEVARRPHGESLRGEQLAFRAGDGGLDGARREALGVGVRFVHGALDHVNLIGVVVDGEGAVEPNRLAVAPQNLGAEGVKRPQRKPLRAV